MLIVLRGVFKLSDFFLHLPLIPSYYLNLYHHQLYKIQMAATLETMV